MFSLIIWKKGCSLLKNTCLSPKHDKLLNRSNSGPCQKLFFIYICRITISELVRLLAKNAWRPLAILQCRILLGCLHIRHLFFIIITRLFLCSVPEFFLTAPHYLYSCPMFWSCYCISYSILLFVSCFIHDMKIRKRG